MRLVAVTEGVYWVEVPEANLYVACGTPADSIKHLMKNGLVVKVEKDGITYESGPNAILLSDVLVQSGAFSNLAEFPVLQMLYRQGMLLPNHPNNTGEKPLLIGSDEQVMSQMRYIYRGNYGLISHKEISQAGIPTETAVELMLMKLKFAFGKIRPSEELLDSCIVGNEQVEIKNGVFIRRLALNTFEFQYEEESVVVDLNLDLNKQYGVPYSTGFHNIDREYFAVIHSGEGDGWDTNRPSMSSIIMYQGKIYLIDTGPNLSYILNSLGIGINEVEGIFHTHCHDDHFCGLPALVSSDHRIKYYATSLIRSSVMKKLSALTSVDENEFYKLFDVIDLDFDIWNDVEGLEVMPMLSPHPVETNVFLFRALSDTGYCTYGHFADLASFDVLDKMVTKDGADGGISRKFVEETKEKYLIISNLKKVDIGGGLIHGNAEDFRNDPSDRILLSHTERSLTDAEKEIGSRATFGTVDVLISTHKDYLQSYAHEYLQSYFPTAASQQVETLLNHPVITIDPGSILIKSGEISDDIYLILTGNVEAIIAESGVHSNLSAGAMVGEISSLLGVPSIETFRAANYVHALKLTGHFYLEFVKRNGLYEDIERLNETREFLQTTWLFGDGISYPIQNKLAQDLVLGEHPVDYTFPKSIQNKIFVVKSGRIERRIDDDRLETLNPGDFFYEDAVLSDSKSIFNFNVLEEAQVYSMLGETLLNIPVIRWKLYETYKKRMRMLFDPTARSKGIFLWRFEYSVNIHEFDKQHGTLFDMANTLYDAIDSDKPDVVLHNALDFLIRYTEFHFASEEQLMRQHDYPGYEEHFKEHKKLIEEVQEYQKRFDTGEENLDMEFIEFFKDWIINHILDTDRKYSHFFNHRGVF